MDVKTAGARFGPTDDVASMSLLRRMVAAGGDFAERLCEEVPKAVHDEIAPGRLQSGARGVGRRIIFPELSAWYSPWNAKNKGNRGTRVTKEVLEPMGRALSKLRTASTHSDLQEAADLAARPTALALVRFGGLVAGCAVVDAGRKAVRSALPSHRAAVKAAAAQQTQAAAQQQAAAAQSGAAPGSQYAPYQYAPPSPVLPPGAAQAMPTTMPARQRWSIFNPGHH